MHLVRPCLVLVLSIAALAMATVSARAQATSEDVFISVLVNNIPKIDTTTNSFQMDAYFRFAWADPDIDPTRTMEIVNPFDGWKARATPVFDAPRRHEDGTFSQVIRYEGTLATPLLLTDYPFEHLTLRMIFQDRGSGEKRVVYRLDETPAVIGQDVTVRAYRIGAPVVSVTDAAALTDRGFGAGAVNATRATLTIPLSRNGAVYGVKVIMPILVVVVTGLLALLLDRELASAQVALLATTLLSLIVLQLSTAPKANYLTMLDMVFVLGRLLLAVGLIRVVYAHFRERSGHGPASHRTDARLAVTLIGVLIFGTIVIAIGHLAH